MIFDEGVVAASLISGVVIYHKLGLVITAVIWSPIILAREYFRGEVIKIEMVSITFWYLASISIVGFQTFKINLSINLIGYITYFETT